MKYKTAPIRIYYSWTTKEAATILGIIQLQTTEKTKAAVNVKGGNVKCAGSFEMFIKRKKRGKKRKIHPGKGDGRSNSFNGFHAKYYNSSFTHHMVRLFRTPLCSNSILLLIQVSLKSIKISVNDTTVH